MVANSTNRKLIVATSYQAANMIILNEQMYNQKIIIGRNLEVYFDFLSKNNTVVMLSKDEPEELKKLLEKLNPEKIIYWDYAMSDLAIFIASYCRKQKIRLELQLPSTVHQDLYLSNKFDPKVAIKSPKSLLKMIYQKLTGAELKIKTFRGQLWYCIKERPNVQIKLFSTLINQNYGNSKPFQKFSETLVKHNHPSLKRLFTRNNVVVFIDEDLDCLTANNVEETSVIVNSLKSKLNHYRRDGYSVYLKPNNYGKCFLDKWLSFDNILPANVPLQVFDVISQPGSIITGFMSSYLEEKHINFKSKKLTHLLS